MRTLPENEVTRIYRETIRPLYAYVSRRVGGDISLAEDFVQEAWMRALNDWPGKGVPNEPLAWLLRVAHNVLVSHFRRVTPQQIDPAFDVTAFDIEDEKFSPASPDAAAAVGWGMTQLRRSHSEILEAFYFEGKTVLEIAAERSLSERAVEGRLRRARAKLKKKLDRLRRPPVASRSRENTGEAENARQTPTQ
jgi:RNA polymerase sigma-70 factor (ECF subfamily)